MIARITLAARIELVPAVMSFVRDTSLSLGLDEREAQRLELVAEEACMNVIEHAFNPGEAGAFDVMILRRPGQVAVVVEDQGLPFDFSKLEPGKESGLGTALMKAFTDEVNFLNLGRQGKRVELVKNLPYKDIEAYVPAEEKESALSLPAASADTPIVVRRMQPEDAVSLARCIYRCYGYSYGIDWVYYPDRVRELLESGLLLSYIALNPEGEVIGHIAVRRERPDAHVGEGGQAVVDPRYRGLGFLGKLVLAFAEYAQQQGIYGAYSEAVTLHPFSQKASLAMGGYETGVMIGYIPGNITFKKMREDGQKRQTAVLLYTSGNAEPQRDVYPPFHHETIIRKIYNKGQLKRNIISASDAGAHAAPPPNSQVDISVHAELGMAFMRVTQFGLDLPELMKFRLTELCLKRVDCIFIDLPLSNPATQKFTAPLEALGFFFAGIIPELSEGDVLRLQYLNNVEADENVHTASDFGKELLEYVTRAGRGG